MLKTHAKHRPVEQSYMKILKNTALASFAACVSEIATIPMDTVKVRLQMQTVDGTVIENPIGKESKRVKAKYKGLVGTTRTVVMEEGVQALY